jgi:hypothetical protein
MREFEMYEIAKYKCIVCGCKNKVHTELLDRNKRFRGYSLKCCGCGNTTRFLLNYDENGKGESSFYINGHQRCIQPSFCPHKDCELYGTCNMDDYKTPNRNVNPPKQPTNNEDEQKVEVEIIHQPPFL